MRVPGAGDSGIVDTSNWDHLQGLDRLTGGRAIMTPTLAELLDDHGARLAVASTSSAGAAILWTRKTPYRVVNTSSSYGRADLVSLREKLGTPPPAGHEHRFERLAYAARAVSDIFLDDAECRVIIFWMGEPDASQHFSGLGSPDAISALGACDRALGEVLDALRRKGLEDQFDIFLLSDHGHSTVRHHKSLNEYIERAGFDLPNDLASRIAISSDYVYSRVDSGSGISNAELEALVRWLQLQPWAGAVLGGTSTVSGLPGVLPLAAVWNGHSSNRVPLLAVSPAWTDDLNEFGVPGTVQALTEQVALKSTHGAASPFDLHAFAAVVGPNFRSGVVSDVPSGATDLTPTVLTLLGLEHPKTIDGRVLWEAFAQALEAPGERRDVVVEPAMPHPAGFAPTLRLHHVGPVSYLDRATNG
jgi:hypothetical protein